ncbi:NAD(P)H-hydrate dehydratase [Mucilaginibacter sp. RS28]|uniref:Bifunctional NAD(P)H-hydrate repair enzyme n=1 Tax=Mucilaginibacter straminoryzae TaxID=2932774 RepID=A0A9X1X5F3_9SPHI|nr:NAD(P)H-hydrate dehydratase [Mucilaginibacter straminoryzae]MCJ8211389.1 NAD(P)H-hydrate dehydratase [Mucilaginibacter straminoryzae]
MRTILTSGQIRQADEYTITHEPIASVDLMERAARAFVDEFAKRYPQKKLTIALYCGTGNNGGDGLAIARLLYERGYQEVKVTVAHFGSRSTNDFDENLRRLRSRPIPLKEISSAVEVGTEDSDIIIDALLGTGLNKPISGDFELLVKKLNDIRKPVVSVDIPTGFFADEEIPENAACIKSELTITFQQPKINFLLPESFPAVKEWVAVDIGLDQQFIQQLGSPYQYIQAEDVKAMLKKRERFSNKGSYGHALIVAGQPETMGAALLCSAACVHAGAGLTTAYIPQSGLFALNSYMPEIMAIVRDPKSFTQISWSKFSGLAIGPGLGQDDEALTLLKLVTAHFQKPMVVDADALNVLAKYKELWRFLPKGSILTPHMKEFDRLFGEHKNWRQRVETARQWAQERELFIVLKNTYTIIATPEGKVYFNSTGNPAMATGGMGDVLTGVISALLSQNYTPAEACLAGVYVHGLAGDELALPDQRHVVLPHKVAEHVPVVLTKLMA